MQVIAHRNSRKYIEQTHEIRDKALLAATPENRELITELPSKFGRVEQVLPIDSWDLLTRLVPDDMVLQEGAPFDTEVLVPLLAYIAKNAIEYFQASLRDLFPEAEEITMDELESATSDSGTAFFLLVAPLKGMARVVEKVQDYAKDAKKDPEKWPFSKLLGDLLRATVACADFDAFAEAWQRIQTRFELNEDHGRLKVCGRLFGNLGTELC